MSYLLDLILSARLFQSAGAAYWKDLYPYRFSDILGRFKSSADLSERFGRYGVTSSVKYCGAKS